MIHHVTAVNMLPLPQTDVIDGNSGGGRHCERGLGGGGLSKYLVCIATACKQMHWTVWVVECCYCDSIRFSNCPIKPRAFSLNVYFASVYSFTERGSHSGNIEIKLWLHSAFDSLFSFCLLFATVWCSYLVGMADWLVGWMTS